MILGIDKALRAKENYLTALYLEKYLVEDNFKWFQCEVKNKALVGAGQLKPLGCRNEYKVEIYFSPFFRQRFDRIWIRNPQIEFNKNIHMYYDCSLCLYYPDDIPPNQVLHLKTIIPWISEWVVKYEFWQKYKVWIGKEVKH